MTILYHTNVSASSFNVDHGWSHPEGIGGPDYLIKPVDPEIVAKMPENTRTFLDTGIIYELSVAINKISEILQNRRIKKS